MSMFSYIKKYLHFAILAAVFMVFEVAMDLLQPGLMRSIVDDGVLGLASNGQGNFALITKTGLIMVAVAVFGGLCGSLNNVFVNLSSQNIGNLMRKDAFRRILEFSFPQFDKCGTGALITRITNDITQIENFISMFVRGLIRTTLLLLGSLFCMFNLNPTFGYIALATVPFILGCMAYCMTKVEPLFFEMQDSLDNVNSILQEDVAGIRIIKACVREIYEKLRFGKANDELIKKQLKILLIFAFLHPVTNWFMYLAVAFMLWDGAKSVAAGTSTPGSIMAAITYTTQLLHSVLMLIMIFQSISRGKTSWKRVSEILSTEPELKDGNYSDTELSDSKGGTIEFKDVSFAYSQNDRLVLEHINLSIKSGETIAIMGTTGCGKTSLINLIPRFYEATSGQVLVDGHDVKEYKLEELRKKMAIVLQKAELFNDTVSGNIKWGNSSASEQDVKAAADIAQASEFIELLSDEYDSQVAERGMSLSGGQRQRVSISRAVLKPAEIMIFDDSTSALDLKTEACFYEALKAARPNSTKIIVAQRIASVRRANRIVVLENGSICAVGSHDELMTSCDVYKDIYNSQLGEESANG